MKHLYASLCAALLLPLAMLAQTPGGTVNGTVFAQDTQYPLRFAEVQFDPVAPPEGRNRGGGGIERVRTEVDGSFSAANVPAGDYYVTASAVGYIPERELLLARVNAGADPAQLLNSIPLVHVSANGISNVTVTLERGAVIAGRLQWEDGSPVAGLPVVATRNNPKTSQLPAPLPQLPGGNTSFAMTDDRGAFRIAGLPAGEYLLVATVRSGGRLSGFGGVLPLVEASVNFYAPGVFHRSAAQVFTLAPGEEHSDVRFTMDMRSLRSVSGTAIAASGGSPVASGTVLLTDPNDSSLRLRGSVAPDGSFIVRYVPPGTYMLQLSGASSQPGNGRRESGAAGTTFQPLTQTVTVTDSGVSNLTLSLTPQSNNGR
jgi:hypothetical protein